jgi:putative MATE family efflux protein
MDSIVEMGTAPIGRLLVKYSLPTIAMMVVNGIYNMIDRIFIGQGMGTEGIAAVTAAFPLMLVSVAVGCLFGIGSSTLISIALGEKREREARLLLGQAFAASFVAAVAVAAATYMVMTPILRLLGAGSALLVPARTYLTIILIGFLFQIPMMAVGGSLRCQGRPKAAFLTVVSGVAVNILLAPIFIFALHWGLQGAAWATVAGQAVGLGLTLVLIQDRKSALRIERPIVRLRPAMIGRMMVIGAPVCVVNLMQTGVFAVANASVAAYGGGLGIAMVGIVNTVYMLASFPVQGITLGAQAIWGYNYGGGRYDRVRSVTLHAITWCTGVSFLFTAVVELFPRAFVAIFNTSDPGLLNLGAHGLSVFFLGFGLFGLSAVAAQFFQSIKRPAPTALLLIARNALLIAAMALLPRWFELEGVLYAGPVTDVLTALLSGVLLMMGMRRMPMKAKDRHVQLTESPAVA